MKKIITSLGMLVFVGAVVAGGTGAFFSDTETSNGNVFTAGALDLKVDSVAHINGLVCHDDGQGNRWIPENQVVWNSVAKKNELIENADVAAAILTYNTANPANVPKAGDGCGGTWSMTDLGANHTFFNYGDLKPGDNGENTISLHIDNNDAYMCAYIHNVASDDNGLTEPESALDSTGGAGEGELHQELKFFIWEDDGDNIFESAVDGKILAENVTAEASAGFYPLYTPLTGGVFAGGTTKYMGVYWCYGDFSRVGDVITCNGATVTNLTQTDSLKADISFYIEQARNNANFTCPTAIPLENRINNQD